MEAQTKLPWPSRALKVLLVLLLCTACIPAQSLAFAKQAWANESHQGATSGTGAIIESWAVVYKKGKQYTLVIQNDSKEDGRYGKKLSSSSFTLYDERSDHHYATDYYDFKSKYSDKITNIIVRDPTHAPNQEQLFSFFSECRIMDLPKLDTTNMTSMERMFAYCDNLTQVNLSNFDTSKVVSMIGMFEECGSLKQLDVSSFDTSNVTDMWCMFKGCSSLTKLNLLNFDTSNVTYMASMFANCSKMKSLDLSNFNTSKVVNMDSMFAECTKLTSLDLSNFNTSKLSPSGMDGMFTYCQSLTYLDLSSFDVKMINISSKSNPYLLFGCSSLFQIKLSKSNSRKIGRLLDKKFLDSAPHRKRGFTIDGSANKWIHQSGKIYSPSKFPDREGVYTLRLVFSKSPLYLPAQVYTGKYLKPQPKLNPVAPIKLKSGVDYKISYKNNKKVGTATATIKGIRHIGKKTIKFKINPKGTTLTSVKGAKKSVRISWKKQPTQTTGYQVRYATNKSMKSAKTQLIKSNKKTSLKITKLKGGQTYYVQVRTYKKVKESGKTNTYYSTWSKAKAVRTKK